MPIAKIKLPDGRIAKFNVPEGTSPEEVISFANQNMASFDTPVQEEVVEEIKETPQGVDMSFADKVNAAAGGFAQGATGNFSDEIFAGLKAPFKAIGSKTLKEGYQEALAEERGELKDLQKKRPGYYLGGELGGSIFGVGKALKPFKNLNKGNLASRAGKAAAVGGAVGATYGAGAAEGDELVDKTIQGGLSGAAIGGAFPLAGAALRKTFLPSVDKGTKELASRAVDLDVPLRLDQVSPTRFRKTFQKVSQNIPLSGVDKFEEGQRKAFTRAVAKTIGEKADDLGPETINRFNNRISNKFNSILKGQPFVVDSDDINKINMIKAKAPETLSDNLVSVVNTNADDVIKQLSSGKIDGQKLHSLRSSLSENSGKAEGASRVAIGEMVEIIDDIIAKNLPNKAPQLQEARRQWRNFKTIEPLLEKSVDGNISPTQLLTKTATSRFMKNSKSKVGEDELIDLGRIGKKFLPIREGSDTAQKMALIRGGTGATIGGAGLIDPVTTSFLTGGVMLGNRGLQRLNASPYLVNQAVRGPKRGKFSKMPAVIAAQIQE